MRSLICALTVSAFALGCDSASPNVVDPTPDEDSNDQPLIGIPTSSPFAVERFGAVENYFHYHSGIPDSATLVIRNQEEWTALWDSMLNSWFPKPTMPSVDFSRHMLLVVAMGSRPTGGYSVRIESVSRQNSLITANVRFTSPGPTCFTSQAFTAPADIVRIPRSELPVRFDAVGTLHEC